MRKLVSTVTVIVAMVAISSIAVAVAPITILDQDFSAPFDQDANYEIWEYDPIDDSADTGGIWTAPDNSGYSSTYSGWGDGGPGMHNGSDGIVIADMGQTLSSGIATVTLRLATDYRMGAFGGTNVYDTGSIREDSGYGGDASNMVFGFAGRWDSANQISAYDLTPDWWGAQYIDLAKTRPTFGNVTFELDFGAGTYDLTWDAVLTTSGNTVTWSDLTLNGPFRYLHFESVGTSEIYYDNLEVTWIPEPGTMLLILFGLGLISRKFRK